MTDTDPTIDWLLASDPAIRWQVLRDLLDAPEPVWRAERARVETEGWGARLLSLEDPDGQWAGGAFLPAGFDWSEWRERGQPWTATCFSLTQLREFGLDPHSERARRGVALVGANARWDEGGQPFWQGEVEECINGRTVADGAYFGIDVSPIVARLVGQRLDDGGWNCERANGSTRSSFATTINVLEGLLEFERATGGTPDSRAARRSGEAYLLRARPVPAPEHRRAGRRAVPRAAVPQPLALRHPEGARLFSRRGDAGMVLAPIRGSATPLRILNRGALPTAPGRSTGCPAGGCGSSSMPDPASPRIG